MNKFIFNEIQSLKRQLIPDDRLILFGSQARGDAHDNSDDDFPEKLKTTIGKLFEDGYKPSETKRIRKPTDLSKIVGAPAKHNLESIFYGRTVVFTGALSSMVRNEAQQKIVDIGGILGNSVTQTNV